MVEMFAGAGLFSHAFAAEGFSVELAVEANRHAAATYDANFPGRVIAGDVTKISPEGRCDVLIAGPPCQGFSTLGKRDALDPRNRLSLEVAKWAAVLRPRIIAVENVAAFLTSSAWSLLARRLRRLGYEVTAEVHNAVDFGVPQRRVRSITFATLGRVPRVELSVSPHVSVAEAWDGLPSVPDGNGLNVAPKPTSLALERMRVIPPGGDKRDIMVSAPKLTPKSWWGRKRIDVTDVWGRMSWDDPSNTIRTTFVNPSKGRYIHPEQHRVISLREAARLQSIPDSFAFVGTVPYVVSKQIGNGVPPLLGRAIARATMAALR